MHIYKILNVFLFILVLQGQARWTMCTCWWLERKLNSELPGWVRVRFKVTELCQRGRAR